MATIPNNLYYPIFAVIMYIFMITLIPKKNIQSLFWFCLIWGSGVDFLIVLLGRFFNLFIYVNNMPFDFYGSPLLVNLTWTPAIMLFLYFMPKNFRWYVFPLYLSTFGLIGTLVGFFFCNAGLLKEIHWTELLRFPIIVVWFYIATRHYNSLMSKENPDKKLPPS